MEKIKIIFNIIMVIIFLFSSIGTAPIVYAKKKSPLDYDDPWLKNYDEELLTPSFAIRHHFTSQNNGYAWEETTWMERYKFIKKWEDSKKDRAKKAERDKRNKIRKKRQEKKEKIKEERLDRQEAAREKRKKKKLKREADRKQKRIRNKVKERKKKLRRLRKDQRK